MYNSKNMHEISMDEIFEGVSEEMKLIISEIDTSNIELQFSKINYTIEGVKDIVSSLYTETMDVVDTDYISSVYIKIFEGVFTSLYDIYIENRKSFVVKEEYMKVMSSTNRRCENCTNPVNMRMIYYLYYNNMWSDVIQFLYRFNSVMPTQNCCVPLMVYQFLNKLEEGYKNTTERSHIMKGYGGSKYRENSTFIESATMAHLDIEKSEIKVEAINIKSSKMSQRLKEWMKETKYYENDADVISSNISLFKNINKEIKKHGTAYNDIYTLISELITTINDQYSSEDDIVDAYYKYVRKIEYINLN